MAILARHVPYPQKTAATGVPAATPRQRLRPFIGRPPRRRRVLMVTRAAARLNWAEISSSLVAAPSSGRALILSLSPKSSWARCWPSRWVWPCRPLIWPLRPNCIGPRYPKRSLEFPRNRPSVWRQQVDRLAGRPGLNEPPDSGQSRKV